MSAIDTYGDFEVPEEKEVIDVPKKISLDEVLEKMHSDDSRLSFLREIYSPKNPETGMKILAMTNYNDLGVIEKEADYAIKNGMQHRFERLAKIFVDTSIKYRMEGDFLIAKVKKYKNSDLADYAIKKLEAKKIFDPAIKIAKIFRKKEAVKRCLEGKLKEKMEDDFINRERQYYIIAEMHEQLGNYDEAIDFYLKTPAGHWEKPWESALRIAKKYCLERIKEIAEKAVQNKTLLAHHPLFFIKCAEILGEAEKAKEELTKFFEKKDTNTALYTDFKLIDALTEIGRKEQARELIKKIEKKVEKSLGSNLAELCIKAEDKETAKKHYLREIDYRIENDFGIDYTLELINTAYKKTNDKAFLEKKIEFYERNKQYNKALKLAKKIKRDDLVQTYKRIIEMIKERK